jgi:hypothetical protein
VGAYRLPVRRGPFLSSLGMVGWGPSISMLRMVGLYHRHTLAPRHFQTRVLLDVLVIPTAVVRLVHRRRRLILEWGAAAPGGRDFL